MRSFRGRFREPKARASRKFLGRVWRHEHKHGIEAGYKRTREQSRDGWRFLRIKFGRRLKFVSMIHNTEKKADENHYSWE